MTTTDESALLAAIRANPADDAPRLIYADWLEENGEPERAQFVRVQIELYRWERSKTCTAFMYSCYEHGDVCRCSDPHSDSLRRREAELWREHWCTWFGDDHELMFAGQAGEFGVGTFRNGNGSYEFSRGFVSHVSAPFDVLIGGECRHCEGTKREPRDEQHMGFHGFSCRCCNGTGRGHIPGVLSVIMQSRCAAIERVVASDKRPTQFRSEGGGFWYWVTGTIYEYSHQLPFDLCNGWTHDFIGGLMVYRFHSEAAALEALSRAMIKFACRDS